ncbi:MAG: Lrp/AsnC family transcriptional regulator [Actinomycetota bacterium]|nr:Lrp/AsnC family transcriptional regulator [Actinomycetota bacterium]
MDSLDRRIIASLVQDGRTPYSRIAEENGVATTTVHQRVRRLTEQGIITGTRVVVDWEAVGLPVTALVSVEAPGERPLADVADDIAAIPFVQNCYAVTGEFDLLLTVRARSSDHLGDLLEDLRGIAPGRSRTLVVLATYFEGRTPNLPNRD